MNIRILATMLLISVLYTTYSWAEDDESSSLVPPILGEELLCVSCDYEVVANTTDSAENHIGKPCCLIDFANGTIETITIPNGCLLTHDLNPCGLPLLIFHVARSVSRDFYCDLETNLDGNFWWQAYYVFEFDTEFFTRFFRRFSYPSDINKALSFKIPSSSIPLGFRYTGKLRSTYDVYYLRLEIQDNQKLGYKFVCESHNGRRNVFHEFPYIYDWAEWHYAISNDGKVAWTEPSTGLIYISDGNDEIQLPATLQTYNDICWFDDDRLLILNCAETYTKESNSGLHIFTLYNTKTKAISTLTTSKGETVYSDSTMNQISVSPTQSMISFFSRIDNEFHDDFVKILTVMNLENGQVWSIPIHSLWKEDLQNAYTVFSEADIVWIPNGKPGT